MNNSLRIKREEKEVRGIITAGGDDLTLFSPRVRKRKEEEREERERFTVKQKFSCMYESNRKTKIKISMI